MRISPLNCLNILVAEQPGNFRLHEGVETPNDVKKIKELRSVQIDFGIVAKKLQEIQPYLQEWMGY